MVLNTCLYRQRRSRLSVGHHAFEINGGGNVSLFLKHAIALSVRARLFWELNDGAEVRLTNHSAAGLGPVSQSRNGRLAWEMFCQVQAAVAASRHNYSCVPGSPGD